jgi:hypothetical protein
MGICFVKPKVFPKPLDNINDITLQEILNNNSNNLTKRRTKYAHSKIMKSNPA